MKDPHDNNSSVYLPAGFNISFSLIVSIIFRRNTMY